MVSENVFIIILAFYRFIYFFIQLTLLIGGHMGYSQEDGQTQLDQ